MIEIILRIVSFLYFSFQSFLHSYTLMQSVNVESYKLEAPQCVLFDLHYI